MVPGCIWPCEESWSQGICTWCYAAAGAAALPEIPGLPQGGPEKRGLTFPFPEVQGRVPLDPLVAGEAVDLPRRPRHLDEVAEPGILEEEPLLLHVDQHDGAQVTITLDLLVLGAEAKVVQLPQLGGLSWATPASPGHLGLLHMSRERGGIKWTG